MHQVDVIVLGAGIVGVSTAVHLRKRGLSVALIDRRHPGEEASFGNAGLIARNGFCPISLPRRSADLIDIALKQSTAFHCDYGAMVRLAPWLRHYFRHNGRGGIQHLARMMERLRAQSAREHHVLAARANAERFYRKSGWLQVYRSEATFRADERERHYARIFGIDYRELSGGDLNSVEPGLKSRDLTGVYWPESESVSNPAGVVEALWRYFIQEGGIFLNGDAFALEQRRLGWRIATARKGVAGRQVVVALGTWSAGFAMRFREQFPMAITRGYHGHFRPRSGASLSRPVMDVDHGYTLSPMEGGIRLTTGLEIADRDAIANPIQLERAEKRVRDIFPLGGGVPDAPWMGSRGHMPDSLPVIGASASRPGLWYNFGHGGAGFTLGPLSGRILADMITERDAGFDTAPLSPLRFLT
ncbi:NAD(P)/FAD-dependent oxidoreductase [Roseibium sp.]|uniref:NAD(P)/FAD-dependent oxidoreductase n=1 Tax=Roseibium sp. TaxID=1936156 RepID=UPI003A969AEF